MVGDLGRPYPVQAIRAIVPLANNYDTRRYSGSRDGLRLTVYGSRLTAYG